MPRRRGFFRRIVDRIREVVTGLADTGTAASRRRPRREPPPPREPSTPTTDRGFSTTESQHFCRVGDFEGETATWTVAGWVTTNQDRFNSWVDSGERDSSEPDDGDLADADYALVDIRVSGGQHVLPFVGPFPGGRPELDQHVADWLEQGSPPGQWGAG